MCLIKFILLCFIVPGARLQLDFGILETAQNPFRYLEQKNYNYENHTITTNDGYQLLLVRLVSSNGETSNQAKPPILFVHGLLTTFYDFLVAGPGISLGFRALESEYDVFLLNIRGSTFSRKHETLDPDLDAREFWNYSWHEMGLNDVPNTIDYILNLTGASNISYVCHSQGCANFLVMTSIMPEYNDKVNLAVFLAPATYMDHAEQITQRLGSKYVNLVEFFVKLFNINEILRHNEVLNGRVLCSPWSPFFWFCKTFLYEGFGPSGQLNNSMVSAYFTNVPAGIAMKQFLHYYQVGNSGILRQYDYGASGNNELYGQPTPPVYDLTKVTAPVAVYRGNSDYVVSVPDSNRLVSELPNVVDDVIVSAVVTNHFDVLVGTRATDLVNNPVLALLDLYNN